MERGAAHFGRLCDFGGRDARQRNLQPVYRHSLTHSPGLKARDSIPGSTCSAGLRQSDAQSTGVFRLRVSLGDDSQTFHSYVLGRVAVPQVVRSTPRTGPLPLGERKVVVLISACGTELGRWKEPAYLHKVFAVPQGFVFHLAQQLSE